MTETMAARRGAQLLFSDTGRPPFALSATAQEASPTPAQIFGRRPPPGDPARHLVPGCAGAPHRRPLKAGHRPAAGDTRRRHGGGGQRKKKGKRGEPADPHPRLADRPAGRPLLAPSPPASLTVTRRRQAPGAVAS
jgi:hypothetical protein